MPPSRYPPPSRCRHRSSLLFPPLVAFLLLLLLLLQLSSPVVGINEWSSNNSASFLEWQFCHFAKGVLGTSWSVTTSGFLVTSPVFSDPSLSTVTGFYALLGVTGTRVETMGGKVTSALITGVIAQGGWLQNDNTLQTSSPLLTANGIAYSLDRNVTVWGADTATDTINLSQDQGPAAENWMDTTQLGLSYFVFSAGNTDTPLQCPPPTSTLYSFRYYGAPTGFEQGLSSICATGTLSLSGPYYFIEFATGEQYQQYINSDSNGRRLFVNQSSSQHLNFSGVSQTDGGDFTYYANFPYADGPGLSFITTTTPYYQGGGDSNGDPVDHFINLYTPDHVSMVEIGWNGDPYQIDMHAQPYTAELGAFQCPAGVVAIKWDYCFLSTGTDSSGARWAVIMNGTLISTAVLNHTVPSYLVTAALGYRTQIQPDGSVVVTTITGVQTVNGYAAAPTDARMYVNYPTLSEGGIAFTFDTGAEPVTLPYDYATGADKVPPVWLTTVYGSPAAERFVDQSAVDYSTFVYQQSVDQWDLVAPASLPCALPARFAGQLNTHQLVNQTNSTKGLLTATPPTVSLPFYYSAVPALQTAEDAMYGSDWSICATGIFTAIGPFYYGGAAQYQVLSVSGQRLFLDEKGRASTSQFVSVSVAAGADQWLYSTAPYVDAQGITLVLSPNPVFANANPNRLFNFVHFANGTGETTGTYVPSTIVSALFSVDSTTRYSCAAPSTRLETEQNGGVVLLGVFILLFGTYCAISTIEQIYASFRRMRPFALLVWLSISTLAISVPVWAGIATYYVSISVDCPNCLSPLTSAYSLQLLLLAWIPAVLGVFVALCVMLASLRKHETKRVWALRQKRMEGQAERTDSLIDTDAAPIEMSTIATSTTVGSLDTVDNFYSRGSADREVRPMDGTGKTAHTRIASIIAKARTTAERLQEGATRHILVAAAFLTMALVLTRYTLTNLAITQADTTSAPVADGIGTLIVYGLCCFALLLYFYSPHFRWLSSAVLTAAVLIDCQLHFSTDTVSYDPDNVWKRTSPSSSTGFLQTPITGTAILVVTGCVGAVALSAVLYMLVYRIRMSRRQLARAMRKTTTKLNSAQSIIAAQKLTIRRLEIMGVESLKSLDAIAMLRPTVQGSSSKGTENANTARSIVWAIFSQTSSAALQRTALHRSGALVAPVLFGVKGALNGSAMPLTRAVSPPPASNGDSGVTFINMKNRTTSVTVGTTVVSMDDSDRRTGTPVQRETPSDSPLPPRSLTPNPNYNGGETAIRVNSPTPTRYSSTGPLAPHGTDGGDLDDADVELEAALLQGMRKLGKQLLAKDNKEEELLLHHLSGLPKAVVEASDICNAARLIPDVGDATKDIAARLTRLAASTYSYRPPLTHILSHPVCTELLKDHMQTAASVENVLFLIAADRWKQVRSNALRHVLALLIFDEFIAENSVHQINIEATQRAQLAANIAKNKTGRKVPAELFDRAVKEVAMLIETNNWKSFVKTSAYVVCTGLLIRNCIVMKALELEVGQEKEEVDEDAILSVLHSGSAPSETAEEDGLPGVAQQSQMGNEEQNGYDSKRDSQAESSISGGSKVKESGSRMRSIKEGEH